ncbi:MAG: methylenetetrahydrofolate reductase C-terminal domain-containing protein [Dehalococcoidales bacterium]
MLLSRIAHALIFEPKSPLFKVLKPLARFIDCSRPLKKLFTYLEHLAKVALFGCMNCGDCALFDVGYLCPMSQCPKNQRNGPCGGSFDGWCEVYPGERKCVWVKAYQRLKAMKKENEIGENLVPPCKWELWETSSWLNFYMDRDHLAMKAGTKRDTCHKD